MLETDAGVDVIGPRPSQELAWVLDTECPDTRTGAPLPLLWHWVYLLTRPAQRLGPDGLPTTGVDPLSPPPGTEVLLAGGRVHQYVALRYGEPARRTSRVKHRVTKTGTRGPLRLVTVEHQITQNGRLAISEEVDVAYRSARRADDPMVRRAGGAAGLAPLVRKTFPASQRELVVDRAKVSKFSALVGNSHRIHLDPEFARSEGWRTLLVPGPLQCLVMAEALRAGQGQDPQAIEYRYVSPLYHDEGLLVSLDHDDDRLARSETRSGRECAWARAVNAKERPPRDVQPVGARCD